MAAIVGLSASYRNELVFRDTCSSHDIDCLAIRDNLLYMCQHQYKEEHYRASFTFAPVFFAMMSAPGRWSKCCSQATSMVCLPASRRVACGSQHAR